MAERRSALAKARVEPSLLLAFQEMCRDSGFSFAGQLREAMRSWLEQYEMVRSSSGPVLASRLMQPRVEVRESKRVVKARRRVDSNPWRGRDTNGLLDGRTEAARALKRLRAYQGREDDAAGVDA